MIVDVLYDVAISVVSNLLATLILALLDKARKKK